MLYIHSMHVKLFRQFTKRTNRLSKNKGHADSKVSCKEWLWRKSICNFIDLIWSQIEVTTICMVTTQWRTSISKKEKETMKWCNLQQLHAHTLPASNFNVPTDDIEKQRVFFLLENYRETNLTECFFHFKSSSSFQKPMNLMHSKNDNFLIESQKYSPPKSLCKMCLYFQQLIQSVESSWIDS